MTGFKPGWFYKPDPKWLTGPMFVCGEDGCEVVIPEKGPTP